MNKYRVEYEDGHTLEIIADRPEIAQSGAQMIYHMAKVKRVVRTRDRKKSTA